MQRWLIGILSVFAFAAAGCGGEGDKNKEASRGACGAAPAALSGEPQLPQGFPTPDEVTYTADKKAGPSRIVEGYWNGELGEAYDGYKGAFDGTSFSVTKDEREEDDAEVNFEGDAGTGQVKLVQECADRTTVRITVRPK